MLLDDLDIVKRKCSYEDKSDFKIVFKFFKYTHLILGFLILSTFVLTFIGFQFDLLECDLGCINPAYDFVVPFFVLALLTAIYLIPIWIVISILNYATNFFNPLIRSYKFGIYGILFFLITGIFFWTKINTLFDNLLYD